MDRFVRQRTLAAVGDSGQQRIFDARYPLCTEGGVASSVERQYLERAGARHFQPIDSAPAFLHAGAFEQRAAREFAAGAWRALRQLRRALERAP